MLRAQGTRGENALMMHAPISIVVLARLATSYAAI